MSDMINIPKQEWANVEERVRTLAREKSSLQLLNHLMSHLSEVTGLENTSGAIIRIILDNLGGTNVSLYYWIGSHIHCANAYDERKEMDAVDDAMVRTALERRELVEETRDFADTKMLTPAFTKASSWALPLMVGDQLIGALKTEGMLMAAAEIRNRLQPFFDYAALVLHNEIESHLKTMQAAQLAAIVQSSNDAIIGKTLDGIITSWNRGAEMMYGYVEPEVQGRPISLLAPPERQDELPPILTRIKQGLPVENYETWRRRKDGRVIPVSLTISSIKDAAGRIVGASTIARDISVHKQAETELRRLNRALKTISECNQVLVRAPGEAELLRAICDVVVKEGGYRMVWVGFAEQDENKTIRPVAHAGCEEGYIERAKFTWADTERGRGPSGTAIRSGRPAVCHNIRSDPNFAPWREDAVKRGYAACAVFPLLREDKAFGGLAIYASEADTFDAVEVKLLLELADDLAYGLLALRTRTAHEQAEATLRERERNYRIVADNTYDWEFWLSPEGRFLYTSPSCEQITGYKPADFEADPDLMLRIIHPEDRPQFETHRHHAFEGHGELEQQFRIVRSDGAQRWIGHMCGPVHDETGAFLGVRGSNRDITERKHAEEMLHRSEAEFRGIFEMASVGMTQVDPHTRKYLRVNQRLCSITGYSHDELLQLSVPEITHPDDRQHDSSLFQQVVSGTLPEYHLEKRYIRKDGSIVWVHVNMTVIRDATGQPLRGTATVEDITARKGAEDSLARRTHQLELLARAGQKINTVLEVPDVLRSLIAAAMELTGAAGGAAGLMIDGKMVFTEYNHRGNLVPIDYTFESGYGVPGWIVATKAPYISNDAEHDAHVIPEIQKALNFYNLVDVPVLNRRGELIGCFEIHNTANRRPFDKYDVEILQGLAASASIALENAMMLAERKRVEDVLRRSEQKEAVLNQIAHVFLTTSDEEMYKQVLGVVLQAMESRLGLFGYIGTNGDLVVPSMTGEAWSKCKVSSKSNIFPQTVWGTSLWGRAIKECKTFNSDGPFHLPKGHIGIEHFLTVPIVFGSATIGLLSVANPGRSYTPDDQELLESIATSISPILNARLQRDKQEQERQKVEKERDRLAMAVEQAAETIVITDVEGNIVYANPVFEKSTGYSVVEVLGKNPRILKSGKLDTAYYRQMWDTLMRGEVWHGHFHNKRKDGTLYEEEATISPVHDASGRTVNYIALKLDVTREMLLEQQLRQSQKMEAVGQLAGGVAHDFNNILTAIMMNLGLLQTTHGMSADVCAVLQELEAGATRASNLTRQLLMFSRRSVLEVRVLDLNKVVTEVLKMLGHLLGEHIEIRFTPPPNPMLVEADAGMMEQVLMNLTVNARDAMPQGGRVTIRTEVVELDADPTGLHPDRRQGRFACLSVTDTGCGMEEATLKRIFEPFFTTKEPGKGTGLGLATVYGIVKQHRGWVEVESQINQGTTFRVLLPMAATPPVPREQGTSQPIPTGQETLLVVEDAPDIRRVLVQTLRVLGYRVLEASSGKQALAVWQEHRQEIDLLLTDMIMPEGMTGLELAKTIRSEKPGVKIIISSGYNTELAHREKVPKGITYLLKPYKATALGQTVRDSLDNKPTKA